MAEIIDRIQKLLKLAGNAGSEAEAALAAQRARDLMLAHNIAEAELRINEASEPRPAEEIIRGKVTDTRKKVAWQMRIAGAVDESYGCHAYWHGGAIMFFGRISAVQAATYTTQYLMREVERITDEQAPTSIYSRKYRNGFRLGCASRIASRIRADIDARKERERGNTPIEIFEDILPAKQPKASEGVLAVIKRDEEEVNEAYADFMYGPRNPRTGKRRRRGGGVNVGNVSSHDGYTAGKAAGNRVRIGAARGGLPKGQESLK